MNINAEIKALKRANDHIDALYLSEPNDSRMLSLRAASDAIYSVLEMLRAEEGAESASIPKQESLL